MSSSTSSTHRRPAHRIAYITTAFPWRSETAVIKEMHELEELGYHIQVISLKRTSFQGTFDPKASRFQDRTLYPGPLLWMRSLARSLVQIVTRSASRRLLSLTLRHSGRHLGKNLYILFFLVPEIARRLQRDGVSYVHANFSSYQAYAAMAVQELTGIPFGFTVHAQGIFLNHFMIPEKVAKAALVVSISRYNLDYLEREFSISPEHVRVIHCGVDLAEFSVAQNGDADLPLMLSVGRMEAMKGFDTLLEACALLRQHHAFRCVLVGKGPELESLKALAARRHLEQVVEFRSGVPQAELVELYQSCSLYVQPCRRTSAGTQDGIPSTLMEAMAVAKPAISTYVSGIPELIQDGVEGRLVPPEDPKALCQAIRDLLDDPQQRARMGLAGRAKIEREFNIAVSARELATLIENVLSEDTRP